MQQVITRTAEIILSDEGILHTRIFEGAQLTLKDVQEYYAFTRRLAGEQKVLALIDGRASFTITDEARAYAAEQSNITRRATALITSSAAVRVLYNLFVRVNRPLVPTKMFSDEKSAVAWLKTFNAETA
jgi:hypothetical protein